jgi:hypothetical protein
LAKKVTASKILLLLSDGTPRSLREIRKEIGLGRDAIGSSLSRLWKNGSVLRTKEPNLSKDKIFRGRAGKTSNLRLFHLYVFRPGETNLLNLNGQTFVSYRKEYADRRGSVDRKSKSMTVLDFIKANSDKAFYSKELVEILKVNGIKPCDIMSNVRRFERNGLVYVRGYRMHDKQTPFKEGYLLTWIDSRKPRELAIEEAIKKTTLVLENKSSTSPIVERIHLIRDQIIEGTKLRDLVSFEFLRLAFDRSKYSLEPTRVIAPERISAFHYQSHIRG